MKMRPIHGLEVPAGKSVQLKPGGCLIIMFMKLKPSARWVGEVVKGSLTFEKAGTMSVDFPGRGDEAWMGCRHEGHGQSRPAK